MIDVTSMHMGCLSRLDTSPPPPLYYARLVVLFQPSNDVKETVTAAAAPSRLPSLRAQTLAKQRRRTDRQIPTSDGMRQGADLQSNDGVLNPGPGEFFSDPLWL